MQKGSKKKILKITGASVIVTILAVATLTLYGNAISKLDKQEQNKLQATTISKEFKEISGGVDHSLAIDTSNNLWAWGDNSNGELGNGTNTNSFEPVQIKSGTKFSKISAGDSNSLAIDTSGNLWGWGRNKYGELANGTQIDSYIPVQIKSGTKFSEVAINYGHTFAIDTSGNLWAWGRQFGGMLGDGSNGLNDTISLPIQIKSETKFSKVYTYSTASFAIDTSGNLWGWGFNMYGQLGNGTTVGSSVPIQIQAGTKFSEVATGYGHTLAIDTSGNLWAWGYNKYGQLGNGGTGNATVNGGTAEDIIQTIPVIIKNGTKFTKVSAGDNHSAAIDGDGNLWTWGKNDSGQLGDHSTRSSNIPIQITAYNNETRVGAKFRNISAGTSHTLAIDTLNTLWSCGYNGEGQLGDECEGSYSNYYPFLIPVPRIDYPINYVLNGGTISIDNPTYRWRKESSPLSTVTKQGYIFKGWCTDASLTSTPIWDTSAIDEGTKTYYAKFEPAQVGYKVEHYKQNETKTGYELSTTENLRELTGTNVTATPKIYTGFTENTSHSGRKATGTVAADGSLVLKLYYDRNTYQVNLDARGGTINSGNITSYNYGVETTLPTNVTRPGYIFKGWYLNTAGTGNQITKISATESENRTFYAVWQRGTASYKVEYYLQNIQRNGYDKVEADSKTLTGTTESTVTSEEKTYVGFTENTSYIERNPFGVVAGDGSLVLKRYYDRNRYRVELDANGGTIHIGYDVTGYFYGVEVNLPTPEKPGYTFGGWYTNQECTGTSVTKISTTDVGAKTYYAKWTASGNTQYKVEYYKQNLSKNGYDKVEEDSKTLTGTTGASVTAQDKAYTGFSLNGASSVRTGNIAADGSLVLRMYYDRNTYHVTLNPGDGTLPEGSENIDYTYGEEKPLSIPEKEGYNFTGWYDEDGNKVEKIAPEDVGDKEYTARYEVKTYAVTFINDGQTVDTQTVNHGNPVTAPSITKPGYTLTWDKDLSKVTSNMTVTAIWTAGTGTEYKVEYYKQNLTKNGYDKVEEDSKTLTGTTGASVTAQDKAYTGFSLNGASSVRTGNIAADGSLVLRMYYDRNTYHVTLNPGDGTLPEESKNIDFTYGEEKPLPIPEKEGYDFTGWYNEDGNKVDKITPEDVGDKEYTARYEIKTYTVTFINDGQTVDTQTVNHGNPVTAPSITKPGYTLTWDKDLSKVTSNMTVTAIWTAKEGTAYKIEYYHQNLAKTGYELVQTETLTGKTGDTVTVVEGKAFRGFSENKTHANRIASGVILGDGTLTLKLYYDRNTYQITLDPGEGTIKPEDEIKDYTFGEEKPLPTPERPGYIFDGWYDEDGNKVDKVKPTDDGNKNYHANWVKEDEYYITSPKYEINKEEKYIMRVSPNVEVTVFLSNIRTNGTPKVLNAKKEEIEQDSLVGTGYILQVDYKGTIYEYEIAVRGDLDGNGKVTVTDLSMLNQALVKRLELTGMRKIAGDIDYNKEVSVTDLSMMNQYFVKKIEL